MCGSSTATCDAAPLYTMTCKLKEEPCAGGDCTPDDWRCMSSIGARPGFTRGGQTGVRPPYSSSLQSRTHGVVVAPDAQGCGPGRQAGCRGLCCVMVARPNVANSFPHCVTPRLGHCTAADRSLEDRACSDGYIPIYTGAPAA